MSTSNTTVSSLEYRLFDFNEYNSRVEDSDVSDSGETSNTDNQHFMIQMFGVNEKGETCAIFVKNYCPFFYIKVDESWGPKKKEKFTESLKKTVGKYYESSILSCDFVRRKKLYGFDAGKDYRFILIRFQNTTVMNRVKNLWYTQTPNGRKLLPGGYVFDKTPTELYEAQIPPLLRFFHIQEISPSGWIQLPSNRIIERKQDYKTTTCTREFEISYKDIISLPNKETLVPYKICSFDIEASSSHGDFPIPIKTYKKLATNVIDNYLHLPSKLSTNELIQFLETCVFLAFGYNRDDSSAQQYQIDKVYPKMAVSKKDLETRFRKWISQELSEYNQSKEALELNTIERIFSKAAAAAKSEANEDEGGGTDAADLSLVQTFSEEDFTFRQYKEKGYNKRGATVLNLMQDTELDRDTKINELCTSMNAVFPKLEGDKVTFIGSTFLRYGESEPYFNHCVVLGSCDELKEVEHSTMESYATEKELLVGWTALIQREDPDIIIGYNIFGFDYEFMFRRAQENGVQKDFLKLSRNIDEICASEDRNTGDLVIEESSLSIASGQYELHFIKMNGRLQVDLLNYFRREFNLTSYKLDYVSGQFICDSVKKLVHGTTNDSPFTEIHSKNLTGLHIGGYIHFEESSHSTDYYKEGAKFQVLSVDREKGTFQIAGHEFLDMTKSVKWGLAKDDVTPQDIFRLTNGTSTDRALIAKYCIQDCNLVHHLLRKVDVITGFVEMARICSVPMNFLVMRGQGIKLTSYIAKKCREKKTLMPVLDKKENEDGYEGAIVLEPKCNIYLDNPVACVDYASLYPSSMISENISHDSKVWTKEYDLNGVLIEETGYKTEDGTTFLYDNLEGEEYIDITYDTYKWMRPTPKAAAVKVKSGTKICRYAQNQKGIMPSILEELLAARKATRKQIPLQNDEFMKNILDKRQLSYKLCANSLYGQCGARTSSFYEKDVAASTTATGRLMLTYAEKVIETTYRGRICSTEKYGNVMTNAERIYGDTDSVFFTFNLSDPETGEPIRGKKALEITIELAQEAGHLAGSFLKAPQDLEYEKTFMPFVLLSKKRYVGMLYETDANKCKQKSMGIVLKRRDNANIVKDVYGGIIDILMQGQTISDAIHFLRNQLGDLVEGKTPIEKLVITKSLRSDYKKPDQIAHKVLAERLGKRDPGNKPAPGDRIPYVYVLTETKSKLQGDRIELPSYVIANHIPIDYAYYISNQVMKPLLQLFGLVIHDIPQLKQSDRIKMTADIRDATREYKEKGKLDKLQDKIADIKERYVKSAIFDEFLYIAQNKKNRQDSVMDLWKRMSAGTTNENITDKTKKWKKKCVERV